MSAPAPPEGSVTEGPFVVGRWQVEPGLLRIAAESDVRLLEPRVMSLLVYLARRAGETVTRERIVEDVWDGAQVVDGALTRAVSSLRAALDDDAQRPRFVQTVPRIGYRFIAAVEQPRPLSETVASPRRGTRVRPTWFALTLVAVLISLAAWRLLDRGDGVATADGLRSVAVLPFDDLSPQADDAWFAQGMADALIAALARVDGLRVIAPDSSRTVAGESFLGIRRRLAVDAVVRGSVVQTPERVRVTVRLVAAETAELLWAESFERPMRDVLVLQAEIARAIVQRVDLRLRDAALPMAPPIAVDPEAYRLVLRARYHLERRGGYNLETSRDLFRRAIDRDPSFALAHAGLGETLLQLTNYGQEPPAHYWTPARSAVDQALVLAPDLPDALRVRGLLDVMEGWRFDDAERAYRRALAARPGAAGVRQLLAELLSFRSRHQAAVEMIEQARELDPASARISGVHGLILHAAGRLGEALERLDEAATLDPTLLWIHRYRAWVLERLGQSDAAGEARVAELGRRADDPEVVALRARLEAAGMAGFWRWQLTRLTSGARPYWSAALVAEAHAGVGNREQALRWVRRAVEERGEYFLHLRRSPAFDRLRTDPRWQAVLRGGGLSVP